MVKVLEAIHMVSLLILGKGSREQQIIRAFLPGLLLQSYLVHELMICIGRDGACR